MKGRVWPLMTEMAFVLVSVAVLKEWLFPFLIGQWFADKESASALLEWTAILAGVITALIYIGLGSSAKHIHGLRYGESLGVFAAVHAPVLVGWLPVAGGEPHPLFRFLRLAWEGLLGDALELFRFGGTPLLPVVTLLLPLFLYTAGRVIRVEESREPAAHRGNRSKDRRPVVKS